MRIDLTGEEFITARAPTSDTEPKPLFFAMAHVTAVGVGDGITDGWGNGWLSAVVPPPPPLHAATPSAATAAVTNVTIVPLRPKGTKSSREFRTG